ncbi:MAG: DUF4214 domain-containing protein, partial [Pyrinomonadaceae bacterium]|nr:DUF4214 domain-containing protein [Pyrinomonadaceae bacterium]
MRYTRKRTRILSRETWLLFLIGGITLASGLWRLAEMTAYAAPITFIVISIGDGADVNVGDGICDGNPLPAVECTLRAAIQEANNNPGPDSIHFNIGGPAGVKTISPASLPLISSNVSINGYTQPGASQNTLANGNNAVLLIALDGSNAGPGANGLNITGSLVSVSGLVINQFEGSGIRLAGNQAGSIITGNFIGTNAAGTAALGNEDNGVLISGSPDNIIGGTEAGTRNVISGNKDDGIRIDSTFATGNKVQGNYIGTDVTGNTEVGNARLGVRTAGPDTIIGGTEAGARNVISGNVLGGISLVTNGNGNVVQGNFIGTKANGADALGNSAGMGISSSNNTVGGPGGAGNTIAFNSDFGVRVFAGTGNRVLNNSIHSNTGLGIDLGPLGVTPNDAGDGDAGVNNLQNFPVLTSAANNSGVAILSGTLNSTPNTNFLVELFSNPACDPSGNGQGHKLIDTTDVTTDANGNASITGTALTSTLSGPFVTATATDAEGNSSEFSQCLQLSPGIGTVQFGETTYSVFEDCTEVILSVSRAGDTSNAASVDYATQPGTATDRSDFTTASGTLRFEAGETAKSFVVLITEDSRVEGTETATIILSNASGATLVSPASATLEILDDPPEPSVNTIDVSEQFVGQHYHDFLNRQHDAVGLNFWTNQIEQCDGDASCIATKRINVSAAFFLSIEFQETGGDVIRTQRAAFGRKSDSSATRITYNQFITDSREVGENVVLGQVGWEQKLEANRQAYAEQVVGSSDFVTKYPLAMTADQYVNALFATAMVMPMSVERQDAISAFGAGGIPGRTAALRKITDSSSLRSAEFRTAFVLMQYFGYLRRHPDEPGYQFWLTKLNQFNGDFVQAEMVRAFISS